MQDVFKKIIEKLNAEMKKAEKDVLGGSGILIKEPYTPYKKAIEIVKQAAEQHNGGWIPCNKEIPPVETEVFILAKRKYKGGDYSYIRTTAMYEDGTVLENDSCWIWYDIDGKWDEENDCYIIPEGWWESKHYNPEECYNNRVDDEVVAWQPIPPEYQTKGE